MMSDVNDVVNASAVDQDLTQESLNENVKELFESRHQQKPARTPVTAFSDGALSSAVGRTSSVVSAQWTPHATLSTPLLPQSSNSSTNRRMYVDIKERLEENKTLKAENFELKKKLFIVMRELPAMKDPKGNDFTEDYLECRDMLYKEQTRRMEAEDELNSVKSEIAELKKKHEQEADEWIARNKRLIEDRNRLSEDYSRLRRELCTKALLVNRLTAQVESLSRQVTAEDGNESQADTSLSNVSIMSSRDRIIEELKGTIVEMTVKEEQTAVMVKRVDMLNSDLARMASELEEQQKALREERQLKADATQKLVQLQHELNEAKSDANALKQEMTEKEARYEAELAKVRKCIETRDRAINALMNKMPYKLTLSNFPDEIPQQVETDRCVASDAAGDENPVVQKLLERIGNISTTNKELRDQVERLKKEGAFDRDFSWLEDLSTDDESSVWDLHRLQTENKKATAVLAREGVIDIDSSCQQMLQMKMREFDRSPTRVPRIPKIATTDCDSSLRSSTQAQMEFPEMAAMADLYSQSVTALDDLGTLRKSVSLLRRISLRLFEKLRGSAAFLQSLLDELGYSEKGRAFINEIAAMRIEFNRSAQTATEILNGVSVAEQSISEFRAQVERSMNFSMSLSSSRIDIATAPAKVVTTSSSIVGTDRSSKYVPGEDQHATSSQAEAELLVMKGKVIELERERVELEQQLKAASKQKTQFEKTIIELQEVNAEKCERELALLGQTQVLTKKIEELQARSAENEFELRRIADEAEIRCRDLEVKKNELEVLLGDSQQVIKEKAAEVGKVNDSLRIREEEFSRYKRECALLEMKTRELIDTVKESIEAMPAKVVKDIATSSREIIDTRSSIAHEQLSAQIALMDVHMTELKTELERVRTVLEECEAGRKTAEDKCRILTDELKSQQVETTKYKKRFEAATQRREHMKVIGTQSEMSMASISALEADLKKLQIANAATAENLRAMCETVVELESKARNVGQNLKPKTVDGCTSTAIAPLNLNKVNVAVMTSMGAMNIEEMEVKLNGYSSFAGKIYDFLGRWSKKEHSISKTSFSSGDLERMYQRMLRMQKITDDEIISLKTQVEANTERAFDFAKDRRKRSSSSNQGSLLGRRKLAASDGAITSQSSSPASLEAEQLEVVRSELSAGDVNEMYRSSHSVVELIKDLLTSNAAGFKEQEATEALQKARTIRSQLAALCTRLNQFEKAKENVDPNDSMETLKAENLKLQLALNDAKAMLMSSHEKLRIQPNSEAMCEAIVRELGKISKAMKSTTRDVCRYRRMRRGSAGVRTESS
uniref:Uncharacterized protein n=3 Tax=Parascaris univalens TaxID=6257 RepID=A0A915BNQ3_PARUN